MSLACWLFRKTEKLAFPNEISTIKNEKLSDESLSNPFAVYG